MKRTLSNKVGQVLTMLLLACSTVYGCKMLKDDGLTQDTEAVVLKRKAITEVLNSQFGTQGARDTLASSLSDEDVKTGKCQWSGRRLWHGKPKNPNWISNAERADGYKLFCFADTESLTGDPLPKVRFSWDWREGGGITSFRGDYSGRDDPAADRSDE